MNQTRLTAYLLLIRMEKNEIKPGVTQKTPIFWTEICCIRLFEVSERKNKAQNYIDRVLRIWCVIQPEPFRSAKQPTHKEYGLFHCIVHGVAVFFVCVRAIIVSWWVSVCECAFLQPRICQPHHNGQAVSQSPSIVAWMKNLNCIEYIAHVVLSLIHICIRFSVSQFFLFPILRILWISWFHWVNRIWWVKFCQMMIRSMNVKSDQTDLKEEIAAERVNRKMKQIEA